MDDSLFEGLIEDFYLEARERLDRIEAGLLDFETASRSRREAILVEVRRDLHTIKGNSGMMGLEKLQERAHRLEDETDVLASGGSVTVLLAGVDALRAALEDVRGKTPVGEEAETSGSRPLEEVGVRVPFSVVDGLFERVSEMVIFRNRLEEAIARAGERGKARRETWWREVEASYRELSSTLDFLQDGITGLRMVPLGNLFPSWRRLVHDEAERRDKEVEITSLGAETPIDKSLLEVASEAVGHLLRNAVVHGIETPGVRLAAGKRRLGRLVVAAAAHGDEIHIDIEDDGRGIDTDALERRARELDIAVPVGYEGRALVFLPGLSTAESTDTSAGRGMGMAAVADAVRRRGGEIEVFSAPGVGTRWRLRLPLSAAIIRALLVEVDGERYALPMLAVHEILSLAGGTGTSMVGKDFWLWHGEHLPLLDLGVAFGTASAPRRSGRLVVVDAGLRRRGLLVDDVVGLREVVVKGLDEVLQRPPGVVGCTVLGDGRVAMILDPATVGTAPALGVRRSA